MWLKLRSSIHQAGYLTEIGFFSGIVTTTLGLMSFMLFLNAVVGTVPSYMDVATDYAFEFSNFLVPISFVGGIISGFGFIRNRLRGYSTWLSVVGVGLGIFGICLGILFQGFIEAANSA